MNTIYKFKFRGIAHSVSGLLNRKFKRPINNLIDYTSRISGMRGIEIGGPSPFFTDRGGLPIYQHLAALDNCNFAESETWHGQSQPEYLFHPTRAPGKRILTDGATLPVPDASYDIVISATNPIKAVKDWMRAVRPGGYVLMVTPEMRDWVDHRRTLTTWEHLLSDYERDIGEDDPTHVDETIYKTDPNLLTPFEIAMLEKHCRNNLNTRWVHHHTWNTALAVKMMSWCGLDLVAIDKDFPAAIVILGQKH